MATVEYSSVQGELGDAQKRLAPHLRMRVDYEQNVEGMEEMSVVTNKFGTMEVEVEKVLNVVDDTPSEVVCQDCRQESVRCAILSCVTQGRGEGRRDGHLARDEQFERFVEIC